jgi:NADPH2:quinone reductase
MRALICDDYQGIDALRVGELTEPKPSQGSLLVQVESVAVNFADTLIVSGKYQTKPETPFAPGHEVSGTVVVANQAPGFSPGDRVCAFLSYGGMAERVAVMAQNSAHLPEGVSSDVGATIPVTYGTSYHALVDRAHLESGERLLILGAAGGVGLAAVQVGKVLGAEIIAAVSSADKAEAARHAGADHVIRYDETPLRDGIAEATAGEGVDVVFDSVGGESTELALRSTRWNGRLLVIGFAAGDIPRIPLNLPLVKGNSIVGVFWGRFAMEESEKHHDNLETIVGWVEDGTLQPLIQKMFSLDDGVEAMRWVADRKAIGRVIINP